MLRRCAGALVIAALCCLSAVADPVPEKAATDKPADNALPPELRFADGSAVRLALLQDQIEVRTKYGTLTVPLAEVRSIEFGLRIPPEAARRLESAAANLASEDFAAREKASAELLALRELAWPTVRSLTKSPDREVSRRAAEIQEKLQAQLTETQKAMRPYDVIRTDAFEIHGLIQGNGLKARSPYFGDVQVEFANLRQYRRLNGTEFEREVVVDAQKYGLQGRTWMDTGFEIDGDSVVVMNVSGEVDLNPQGGNGQFRIGPQGTPQWGVPGNDRFPPGALVGRIGDKGREFLVGEHFEGKPAEHGKVYLRIAGSPWGNLSVGEYKVKMSYR